VVPVRADAAVVAAAVRVAVAAVRGEVASRCFPPSA
jgi:hypothetical protein